MVEVEVTIADETVTSEMGALEIPLSCTRRVGKEVVTPKEQPAGVVEEVSSTQSKSKPLPKSKSPSKSIGERRLVRDGVGEEREEEGGG